MWDYIYYQKNVIGIEKQGKEKFVIVTQYD